MKKIISILTILMMFSLAIFAGKVYAATLDTINAEASKTTINPGEEVTVTITFGEELGAYTFDVAYDDNIFEYVSVDGGTANDSGDKVRAVYYDSTGGTDPRTNMTITFRAKSDITTSNPTQFMITAEGLSNADASETFDDITTPITVDVTVEPADEATDETTDEETTTESDGEEAEESEEEEIAELPQTGSNIYVPFIIVLSALISASVYYNKRK